MGFGASVGTGIGTSVGPGLVVPEVDVAGAFFALWFLKAGVRIGGHLYVAWPFFYNHDHQHVQEWEGQSGPTIAPAQVTNFERSSSQWSVPLDVEKQWSFGWVLQSPILYVSLIVSMISSRSGSTAI